MKGDMMSEFEKELTHLLNVYSQENASHTPDFILAQYITSCLAAFAVAIQQRETWYGRDSRPCASESARPTVVHKFNIGDTVKVVDEKSLSFGEVGKVVDCGLSVLSLHLDNDPAGEYRWFTEDQLALLPKVVGSEPPNEA